MLHFNTTFINLRWGLAHVNGIRLACHILVCYMVEYLNAVFKPGFALLLCCLPTLRAENIEDV